MSIRHLRGFGVSPSVRIDNVKGMDGGCWNSLQISPKDVDVTVCDPTWRQLPCSSIENWASGSSSKTKLGPQFRLRSNEGPAPHASRLCCKASLQWRLVAAVVLGLGVPARLSIGGWRVDPSR